LSNEIRIYFEGDDALRPGFKRFFSELSRRLRCRIEPVAGKSGDNARKDFAKGLKTHPNAWNILLIDSEGPTPPQESDSVFWMVQMMEAWFHADKEALEGYYKTGFRRSALKANPNVEEIPKADVEDGLKRAAKDTTKGKYHKTAHGPALLAAIAPAKVRKAAPNCERLFATIEQRLA
jgi:hypothetical protein